MLQKFNITAYAVVLCLFGFMLFSAAPVFANYDEMGEACKAIEDGSSTDDQIDECFTDIWDRASLSTFDSLADEHNNELQQLKDEHAEAADEYKSEIQQLKDKKDELAEAADEHESEIMQAYDDYREATILLKEGYAEALCAADDRLDGVRYQMREYSYSMIIDERISC